MLKDFIKHQWAMMPVWEMENGVAREDRTMSFRGEVRFNEGYVLGWSLLCMDKVKTYAPPPGSMFYEHYMRNPLAWLRDQPAMDMSLLVRPWIGTQDWTETHA